MLDPEYSKLAIRNQSHEGYLSNRSLRDVSYPPLTAEAERVVNAVTASLADLADTLTETTNVPSESASRTTYMFRRFPALSHVPLFSGTKLDDVMVDSVSRRPEVQRANQRPYLRDFVRSRVANGMVLGVTTNVGFRSAEYFHGPDCSRTPRAGWIDATIAPPSSLRRKRARSSDRC
ncbi:hypothetical protein [Gemmatimonas sp.]|uniref:hypothetical protein n=1 Tax=Gemmatimonas sp. TaxID=1962908 RepID=UPI003F72B414